MLKRISIFAIYLFIATFRFLLLPSNSLNTMKLEYINFKNVEQKKVVEDYFKDAAIPAFNRLGISPVGVFNEAEQKDGIKLYVLIPYIIFRPIQ